MFSLEFLFMRIYLELAKVILEAFTFAGECRPHVPGLVGPLVLLWLVVYSTVAQDGLSPTRIGGSNLAYTELTGCVKVVWIVLSYHLVQLLL